MPKFAAAATHNQCRILQWKCQLHESFEIRHLNIICITNSEPFAKGCGTRDQSWLLFCLGSGMATPFQMAADSFQASRKWGQHNCRTKCSACSVPLQPLLEKRFRHGTRMTVKQNCQDIWWYLTSDFWRASLCKPLRGWPIDFPKAGSGLGLSYDYHANLTLSVLSVQHLPKMLKITVESIFHTSAYKRQFWIGPCHTLDILIILLLDFGTRTGSLPPAGGTWE